MDPRTGTLNDAADQEVLADPISTMDSDELEQNTTTADEPTAIRDDIAHTRADLGRTIDAIQERLSPQRLVNEAKESVKEATVGKVQDMATTIRDSASDASNSFMDTVRQNPIPAAMAGLGLGWLFYRAMQRPTPSRRTYPSSAGRNAYSFSDQPTYGYARSSYAPAYPPAEQSGQTGIGDRVGDATQQVREKVGDITGQVGDRVGHLGEQVQERAGDFGERMQSGAGQTRDWFGDMMQGNPLVMGLAAAALGAAVGFAVKETPQENHLMGDAHDNLLHKAQDVAQDTAQKVQQVAQKATETVKDEAQRQGLVNQS